MDDISPEKRWMQNEIQQSMNNDLLQCKEKDLLQSKEPQVEGEELQGNDEIQLLLSEEEEEASAQNEEDNESNNAFNLITMDFLNGRIYS